MEHEGNGHTFTTIEDRLTTIYPPLSAFDKFKVMLRLKEVKGITVKNTVQHRWFVPDLKYITSLAQITNPNGKTYNTRCGLYSQPDNQWVIVKARFNDVKALLQGRFEHKSIIKGYGR